jgi:hypothetical protein
MVRRLAAAVLLIAAAGPASAQPPAGVLPRSFDRCPPDHPVKGYTSRTGVLVYYLPGGPGYDGAIPHRCFASEQQARAAGYTPGLGDRPPGRTR